MNPTPHHNYRSLVIELVKRVEQQANSEEIFKVILEALEKYKHAELSRVLGEHVAFIHQEKK